MPIFDFFSIAFYVGIQKLCKIDEIPAKQATDQAPIT
jgi:hypothetical protein